MRAAGIRRGVRVIATNQLIAALVAGGMEFAEAAGLVARAAVEMTGQLTRKSPGAIRQQRFRDRNKVSPSVTRDEFGERNEALRNVTSLRCDEPLRTVTNRNESVTCDALSLSKEEKKEVIKKEKRESRALQMPDEWRPEPKPWQAAVDLIGEPACEAELRKMRNHAADKGRVSKNWNAAWRNWVDQAIAYESKRNGTAPSNNRTNPAAGRATAREIQQVTTVGSAALRYLEEGKSARPNGNTAHGARPAGFFDPDKRAKNTH